MHVRVFAVLTGVVSALHMLFDTLAFKNDIQVRCSSYEIQDDKFQLVSFSAYVLTLSYDAISELPSTFKFIIVTVTIWFGYCSFGARGSPW